jgi:valyl-tRNA synthetase
MDPGLSKAVVKVFVQLYKEGLIYKDKRLVNWDPKLITAISDLEVVQVETKGHLWHFKYPIVDDAGTETGEFIIVATTRPETILGDTAVAVHPDDERYKHLHGKKVRLPLVGRLIPIVADTYSDPEKGTGAVKITPAHDFNDFEVGKRHGLPVINVLDAEGKLTLAGNSEFVASGFTENQAIFAALEGKTRETARKMVVEMMEAKELVDKIEPHPHMVPHGDRSGVVIEPWLTEQWYVKAEALAEPALAAVREGKTKFVPENWQKTYFQWLENIQPWCISRQLWWGHQIPAWYGRREVQIDRTVELPAIGTLWQGNEIKKGWTLNPPEIFVVTSEKEAIAQAEAKYGCKVKVIATPRDDNDPIFQQIIDDELEGKPRWEPIWRDEDVLDTWFSSALWPFSTLGWPDETPEVKRYYPTNVLVTGFDIIFFWVARMMMMGLHFMHEVPFHDVYIHALVRDEKGAKMSKSKGNVIDPLNLVDTYGADALRFTLAAMAAQGRDIKLSTQRVEGYRNFTTKLWNAARFAEMNSCTRVEAFDPRQVHVTLNQWIIGEAAKAVTETATAITAYRFNDAANAAYRFVWNIFCDWYLELVKPLFLGTDEAAKAETRAAAAFVLDVILKLLHPFMPFITEELWSLTATEATPRATMLALAEWPVLEGCENLTAEAEIGWVVELISELRSVRSEMNVPAGAQVPLVLVAAPADVAARAGVWEETIKRMARASEIAFASQAPEQSVQVIVRGTVAALPLQGVIDFAAEKLRLIKEVEKLKGEAGKIDAKLKNADFVAKAPEEVVEENRERLMEIAARIEKLSEAQARLGL